MNTDTIRYTIVWGLCIALYLPSFGQNNTHKMKIVPAASSEMIARGFVLNLLEDQQDGSGIYSFNLNELTNYYNTEAMQLQVSNLKLKQLSEKNFSFTIDKNNNGNFEDDSTIAIQYGEHMTIQYPVFAISEKTTLNSYDLPAIMDIGHYGSSIEVRLKPLLKYQIEEPAIEGVDSLLYYPHPILPRVIIKKKNAVTIPAKGYTLLNEPFQIDEEWYVLEHPKLFGGEIKLRKLEEEEKAYGYRKGHYVHLERLQTLVDGVFEKEEFDAPYTLHHFWGPWCAPCQAQYTALLALEKKLENSPINMLHYCFIFVQKEGDASLYQEQVQELIAKGAISPKQHMTILPDPDNPACENKARNVFTEGCTIMELFNIFAYPTYIITNREGKIVYRGRGPVFQDPKFIDLLSDILQQ